MMKSNLWTELKSIKTSVQVSTNFWDRVYSHQLSQLHVYKSKSRKNLNSHHDLQNLLGEIYESYVYEGILDWAIDEDNVDFFILKGPYVKESVEKEGFVYDDRKLILFFSDGIPLTEFDGLFRYKGTWIFFEITKTKTNKGRQNLEKKIQMKFKILQKISLEEFYCIVITPKISRRFSNKEEKIINWVVNEPANLTSKIKHFRLKGKNISKPDIEKLATINILNFEKLHFVKRESEMRHAFLRYFSNTMSTLELKRIITPNLGVIERMILGKIRRNHFKIISNGIELDRKLVKNLGRFPSSTMFLGLKLEKQMTPTLVIYLKKKETKKQLIEEYKVTCNNLKFVKTIYWRQTAYFQINKIEYKEIKDILPKSIKEIYKLVISINLED